MSQKLTLRIASLLPIFMKWTIIFILIDSAAMKAIHGMDAQVPDLLAHSDLMAAALVTICEFGVRWLWAETKES